MSEPSLLVEREEHYAIITLNRPDAMNALSSELMSELCRVFRELQADRSVRAAILTGAGRAFCAGLDLKEMAASDAGLGAFSIHGEHDLYRAMADFDRPIIVAVNGVAAGAGANIALACDLVIAARSAKFIQAFCKLGLVPDSGGTWQLPRLVGMARAKGLAMLGDKLSAEQAADWGLIWQVVDDDALRGTATDLARHLATQPTRGLALIKQALNDSTGNDLDTQLDLERDLQRQAGRSKDYREGVSAFMEKRAPRFTGE